MPTEERPTSDEDKDKDKDDKDKTVKLADDPPIIVGGGGSTWIWIPESADMRTFEDASTIPNNMLPDSDTMPPRGQLGNYFAVYLPGFTVKNINIHDGQADFGDKPAKEARNHRTRFKSA